MADLQLSTRDKNLRKQLVLTPAERMADLVTDSRQSNLDELATAIATTRDPKAKIILQAEQDRLIFLSPPIVQKQPEPVRAPIQEPAKSPTIMDQLKTLLSNMWGTQ